MTVSDSMVKILVILQSNPYHYRPHSEGRYCFHSCLFTFRVATPTEVPPPFLTRGGTPILPNWGVPHTRSGQGGYLHPWSGQGISRSKIRTRGLPQGKARMRVHRRYTCLALDGVSPGHEIVSTCFLVC